MPRTNRRSRGGRRAAPQRDLDAALSGMRRHVDASDGAWIVQSVRGSERTYRCPGCDQLIAARTAHTVAWRADDVLGDAHALDSRRHWHDACWSARGRRRPNRR